MNTIASAPFFVKLFLFFQHFAVFYSSFFVHLDPAFYFIGCMLPHRRLGRIPFIILHFHRICSGFLSFLLFFLLFHPETALFRPMPLRCRHNKKPRLYSFIQARSVLSAIDSRPQHHVPHTSVSLSRIRRFTSAAIWVVFISR